MGIHTRKRGVNEQDGSATVSRRSFIGLTVGTLTTLPLVAGGFALPFEPDEAYAAETNANAAKVVVAKSYEAGIVVADMVDGKKVPVPDAEVRIVSLFNKKELGGKTNSSGVFMADIRKLAQKETVNGVDFYSFDARITVNREGYRVFRVRRISIRGAHGLLVPTRKLSGEKLYPISVSFDDWDVLYTKNQFCVSTANDVRHTLAIELNSESIAPVGIKLVHTATDDETNAKADTVLVTKEGLAANNKYISCEISDFFLLQNHKSAFPAFLDSAFALEITQNNVSYKVPLGLTTCRAPSEASKPSSTKMVLSPFNAAGMKPQIEIPRGVPLLGGDTLQVWTPDLPVEIMFNPFGYFKIAYKSEDYGYKSKDGKPDPNAWKSHPRKTFAQQWKDASDARDKMMKSVGEANRREGVFKKADFTSSLSATGNLSFMLAGRWSGESGLWRGQLGVQITLGFAYAYAQQFMAGPIPLVVEFSLNSSLTIGMVLGVLTPEILKASKYSLDYGDSGVSMTIAITPAISLGVGVKGIMSVSIQGLAAFTLFVNVVHTPRKTSTLEMRDPIHYVLGVKAQANVVVQAFLFTATHILWEYNNPAFYDSWKPKKLSEQSHLSTQSDGGVTGGGSWDTIFGNEEDMDIIPVEDLAEHAEFELAWEDVDVSEYGDDWESHFDAYDETDNEEGYICWGEGLVGGGSWGDEDEDDGSFWFIEHEDGSVSGGGSWDGGAISVQSAKEDGPARPLKVQERVIECVAENGVPYRMTSFELVPAEKTKTQGAVAAGGAGTLMAASSAELTAQSSDGARLSAQSASNVLRRGKTVRKPGKIAEDGTVVSRPSSAPPTKLALDTGLVPQCDKKILEGVFSDSRAKVIEVFGRTYLLRIAAVDIMGRDGQTLNRTRIVAQQLVGKGQEPQPAIVLDFKHTFGEGEDGLQKLTRRDELFDYDFSVLLSEERAGYCNIDLFIISGYRPSGDKTTIGQAASDQVFTHAVCLAAQKNSRCAKLKIKYGLSTKTSAPAFNATGNPNLKYHSFSCPQLVETAEGELIATYLDRAADSPEKVLTDQASVGLGLCFSNTYLGNLKAVDVSGFVKNTDSTVYDMTMLKPVKKETGEGGVCRTHIPISLQGRNGTSFYILTTDMKSKQTGTYDPKFEPQVRYLAKADVLDAKSQKRPQRIVNWPGHEPYVLASIDGKLMKGALSEYDTWIPSFNWEEVGPSDFSISNFGTDATGNFVYWPTTYQGSPGFSYDKAADKPENAASLPEIERFNVMACKLRKGKFSDPFVFAEVGHDMDSLQVVGSQKSEAMAFISSNLRDAKKGKADIWYTSMPNAKCANVVGVEALSEIVHPGAEALFDVTVRNEGNTFLSGFTAQLVEKDSRNPLANVKLKFSKDTLIESGYNPADKNGVLQNVEDDYTLAPGKTSVYRIKFTIPDSWKGEKSISVLAKDAIVSPSSSSKSLETQAEGDENHAIDDADAVEYDVGSHDDDYGEQGMPFDLVNVQAEDNVDEYVEGYDYEYADAPMEQHDGNGKNASGDASAGSKANPTPTRSSLPASTPKTGDSFGPLSGLVGVAAIAGGAMAAYSARRVANERSDQD